MKIYFLGTNGWYATPTGNTVCTLIDANEAYVILDAGNGLYKIGQHITDHRKPIYIFLSHLHLDHIEGLAVLPNFDFPQGITIFVPDDAAKVVEQRGGHKSITYFINVLMDFLSGPITAPYSTLRTRIKPQALQRWERPKILKDLRLLAHTDPCYGYRFELEGKIIAYCTDTMMCQNLQDLSCNADLLIAESGCLWNEEGHRRNSHLRPQDAAEIARKAHVKKLILTHFTASTYTTFEMRRVAQEKAYEIFPDTLVAIDDLVIEL